MARNNKIRLIMGVYFLAGILVVGSGCDFSQILINSFAGNLMENTELPGTISPISTTIFNNSMNTMVPGTNSPVTPGLLPSAQPSPTLQQLLNGPVIGP